MLYNRHRLICRAILIIKNVSISVLFLFSTSNDTSLLRPLLILAQFGLRIFLFKLCSLNFRIPTFVAFAGVGIHWLSKPYTFGISASPLCAHCTYVFCMTIPHFVIAFTCFPHPFLPFFGIQKVVFT